MFIQWRRKLVYGVPDETDFSQRQILPAGISGCLLPQPLTAFKDLAIMAATEDPHNIPIQPGDVQFLECTAMVVTCMEAARDMTDWELGVHGILVSFEDHKGKTYGESYLPGIPVLCGWTKEHTINQLLQKAG